MSELVVLGVVIAFVVGAGLQRIAGMGMGMVAAPTLSLLVGPVAGVTMSNAGAVVTAVLVLAAMRAHVDWSRFVGLAPLIVVGSVIGAFLVREVDPAWLDIVLGGSVLLALAVTLGLQRDLRVRGRGPAVTAGLLAGLMNTTSGVGGPVLAVYAVATRWDQRSFAATLQPVFLLANGVSIASKFTVGATPAPGLLPWWIWPVIALAVLLGVGLAGLAAGRVLPAQARGLAIAIAVTGALLAVVRGLLSV